MIVGVGIDIIEVERIKKALERNPRFLKRVFTQQEIAYSQDKKNMHQHLAARFAAKEAFFKALGRRIGWRDVGLCNLASGKPVLDFHIQETLPFTKAEVSISHLKDNAAAVVILEK